MAASVEAIDCKIHTASIEPRQRRLGHLPEEVQNLFDRARTLERGRRGRCLSNMIRPDPKAALAVYQEGLAALDAFYVSEMSAEIDRIREIYAVAAGRLAANLTSQMPLQAPIDEALRKEAVFQFDTGSYGDLLEATHCILQHHSTLSELHNRPLEGDPPICPALLTALSRDRKIPADWRVLASRRKQHIRLFRRTPEYAKWLDAYRRFVQQVIAPIVGDKLGVVFQCPPTLRCQLPSMHALGHRHKDDEYEGHQGEEINFWLPFTPVWGNNTLHVESEPGKGDFRPVELAWGSFFRFNGGQCEHFTKANDTGSTRVSIDFRVIPRSLWRDQFGGRIGEYPCEMI